MDVDLWCNDIVSLYKVLRLAASAEAFFLLLPVPKTFHGQQGPSGWNRLWNDGGCCEWFG